MIKETINKKIYNIQPSTGEALLNYNGRLDSDKIYMKVYDIDENNYEKVNYNEQKQIDGEIYEADCLSLCAYLKDNNKYVDFVYIDPPFATNINYTKKIFLRNKLKKEEYIGIANESIDKELIYNEIWSKEDYLNWLYTRLIAIREVLSENGSIMVHMNGNIGHYVKILMDEVFGEENFRNEIVWAYRTGGAGKKGSLARKHDSIYFYSKNSSFNINTLKEKIYYDKPFMDCKVDEEGNFYSKTILRDILEGTIKIVEEDETISEYNVQPPLNLSEEFLDYNNQRPMDLLKILIRIATEPGDTVADFFGGSGTTSRAAYELERKFITCDIEKNSIQVMRDELRKKGASFNVYNIQDGINLFKDPIKVKNTILKLGSGEERNESSNYSDFWDGKIMYNNKMTLTKILNNYEILTSSYIEFLLNQIQEELIDIEDCILIYTYKDMNLSQNDIQNMIKEKNLNVKINIVAIESIVDKIDNEIFADDSAEIHLNKNTDNTYTLAIKNYFSSYINQKIKEENKNIKIEHNGLEYIEAIFIDTTLQNYWTSDIEDKADKKSFIKGEYILNTDNFRIKIRNIAGREIIIQSKEVIKNYE